ncbi:hypothetical protein L1987_56137 [Smallanthus sonchifolius]|uniref:Uncharacterized protein n=1 Tax=Smallanthus sonchifolius TaxID=185202 RepID=A0ACB9EBX4_9ASTR|nr:hypothetical protein L1987_56137 [Smallanthus sonchifolius]
MGYLSHRVNPDQLKPGDHIYTWRTAFTYSHHGIYVGENKVIHFTAPETASSGSCTGTGWNLSSGFPSSCMNFIDGGSSQPKSGSQSCDRGSCLSTYACGSQQPESGVIISCLNCFIGTGSLYLYQYEVNKYVHLSKLRGGTCTMAPSDPPEEVIDRAIYLWRNGFGKYNVVRNNCEDFALYCKTSRLVTGKPATGSSGQVNFFINSSWKAIVTSALPKLVFSTTGAVTVAVTVGTHCWNRYSTDVGVRDDVEKIHVERVGSILGN